MTGIGGNLTTPSLFVPDASVIMKWAFRSQDEQDGDKALALLNLWLAGNCSIVLPGLWVYECGNVLGLKAPENAKEIMDIFLEYRFDECPMTIILSAATLQIMKDCKVTFYDAAYHAVALDKNATLITADVVYYRKASQLGNIMLLENFA
jgi:predicted nucleic acid-binding protein